MLAKNLQHFMVKQAASRTTPTALGHETAHRPQAAPLEIKHSPGFEIQNNVPWASSSISKTLPGHVGYTPNAVDLAEAQFPPGYREGAQGNIWRPVAAGYTGKVDPSTYRLYERPGGYWGSSSPGEPGFQNPPPTGERTVPPTVEVDPRPPEQFAEGWAPDQGDFLGMGERSTRRSYGDYSGYTGPGWGDRGDKSRRRIAFDQAPDSQHGYTRVRQRVPGGRYDARRDPTPDYRTGRDPGGNRIFMDPETGMEHWVPAGGEAPQFHHEDRKSTNRDRMAADIEAEGRFRIGDIFRNLW